MEIEKSILSGGFPPAGGCDLLPTIRWQALRICSQLGRNVGSLGTPSAAGVPLTITSSQGIHLSLNSKGPHPIRTLVSFSTAFVHHLWQWRALLPFSWLPLSMRVVVSSVPPLGMSFAPIVKP